MSETNKPKSGEFTRSLTETVETDSEQWHLEEEVVRNREYIQQLHEIVERLSHQLERLTVTCSAMWTLLQKKVNISENDLMEKVQEIDIQEGRSTEKVNRSVITCQNCQRQVSTKFSQCLYCGHPTPMVSAFSMVQSIK